MSNAEIIAAIKAQALNQKLGNPSGFPSWRVVDGKLVATQAKQKRETGDWPSRINPRYALPTWKQIIKAVQKRYGVTWESPAR